MHLREENDDRETIIHLLKYHKHNWIICIDLKMVNTLLGQQKGLIKFLCYLCMWDSRSRNKHLIQKEWPIRQTLEAGMPNIVSDPIFSREKIILPHLHIKLGLMKQFVKAFNIQNECFQYIVSSFSALS